MSMLLFCCMILWGFSSTNELLMGSKPDELTPLVHLENFLTMVISLYHVFSTFFVIYILTNSDGIIIFGGLKTKVSMSLFVPRLLLKWQQLDLVYQKMHLYPLWNRYVMLTSFRFNVFILLVLLHWCLRSNLLLFILVI